MINSVELEEYVACVLRTESWPGWPLEVNKAFAVACRTYVVGVIMMNKNSHSVLPYHVKNTNRHQTYHGRHDNELLYKAAEQTKGIFLAYNDKPIVAMFDSCCGGIIPAQVDGVNFEHAPYLKRNYACTFCKGSRAYAWKAEYDMRQLEGLLSDIVPLKGLKEIKVTKKDKAGIAHELTLKDTVGIHVISDKQLYYALDNVRSFYYTMQQKGSKVYFTGRGIGHHVGLCQWGAREMVNHGYTYKKILKFYYPDAKLMRFY
jgi:stage II sporulation protein D